jgi:acyl-CoA hydrolase/RimJ/RimL family protein N-acetyltransferase
MQLEGITNRFPEKFQSEKQIFGRINPGNRIFIGTACGEPQYLVKALIRYVESNPKAFFDTEVLHIWTLGVAPYTDEKFKYNFRHNSFFIGDNTRDAVNKGLADYTPIFLSQVPYLLKRKVIPIDVALIQTSYPDDHGFVSLGISVDIVKAAVENASLVIAQMNSAMPRVHGDTFIHLKDIDCILPYDEPLIEYETTVPGDIAERIGKHVARIVEDGDTIQVGYGSVPNAILANLSRKKNLGVHTELFTEGIAELMKKGVITNTMKSMDRGKTVAAFCMGKQETYAFINDNPGIEFRTIDYTNNPAIIGNIRNITAINSALEIDLTGQATAESIGRTFYSGIGGQADFMRGAAFAPHGKTILVLQSTAQDDTVSRIVPFLKEGAGVTLTRGDVHYVVTEYGIAYLHGKNIRERAMALISIAHPKFQSFLIEEARKLSLIYKDQTYIAGKGGEYPEELETYRTTRSGLRLLLRPVRIADEPLLKDFFYSLSETTIYKRFVTARKSMPHEKLQEFFVVIDYTKEMVILAILEQQGKEVITGVAQFRGNEGSHTAEVALVVQDEHQNQGVGTELLSHLTYIAKRQGLLGFSAEVLKANRIMLHLFEKIGFAIEKEAMPDLYNLRLGFRET